MQDQKSSSASPPPEDPSAIPLGVVDRWSGKSRAVLTKQLPCLPDVLVDLIGSYLPARLRFILERFVPIGLELFHMCYCDEKVAIVTGDNELVILDGEKHGLVGMAPIEDDPEHPPCDVLSIYCIADGVVAVALRSGSLLFYDVSTDQPVLVGLIKPKELHEQFGVRALKRLSDGRLWTGGGNSAIKIWQLDAGDVWPNARCVKTMKGHSKEIKCLQQIGSSILASGSADNNVVLWDATTGECLRTLTGHTRTVTCLVDLSCGRLASGSWDKDLRIWQTTGECLRIINIGAYGYVRNLISGGDGLLVCHPFASRRLLVYDSETGEKSFDVETLIDFVHALLILPNGRLFVGGSKSGAHAQGSIEQWD